MMQLPPMQSMRDINDYCVANNVQTLAQGMIELPPPECLRKIVGEVAMEGPVHTYRARMGEPEFLKAMQRVVKENGADVECNSLLATQGVSGGIIASLLSLKKKKSEQSEVKVGLLQPFYTYHWNQLLAVGVVPVFLSSIEELKSAVDTLDGFILCNPLNPTGKVWTEEEINEVISIMDGRLIIFDECYLDMVFTGKHYSPIQNGVSENIVICRGFSKTLGAQSWRVGYAISHPSTISHMMACMDPVYICTPFLQHALARFINNHFDEYRSHIVELNKLMRDNWKVLSEAFKKRFAWEPVEPAGTMYGNFKHTSASDMEATVLALQAGVGVCPGSMFTKAGITPDANTNTVCLSFSLSLL